MEETTLKVVLLNGTIATTNGLYEVSDVDIHTARTLLKKHGYISAIGHEATAAIMSELLEQPIEMNRIQFFQEVGQIAIVFKLNERPSEGVVLNREEVERVGYCLKQMIRLK